MKNMNADELEYCDEYLKNEREKHTECELNIVKYTNFALYYSEKMQNRQGTNPLSFVDFYNNIWLKKRLL